MWRLDVPMECIYAYTNFMQISVDSLSNDFCDLCNLPRVAYPTINRDLTHVLCAMNFQSLLELEAPQNAESVAS